MVLDSTSGLDILRSIADTLAKSVAGNAVLAALVLVVLVVFVIAFLSKQQTLAMAALVVGVIAILLLAGLSVGASLPIWYGVLLGFIALLIVAGAVIVLVHGGAKPTVSPTLRPLDDATIFAVTATLKGAADEVAEFLNVPSERVRANVFAKRGVRSLQIVPRLTWQMNDPIELKIRIPIGKGVVGKAWELGKPTPARFDPQARREGWAWLGLPKREAMKANKDLRWVVAMPPTPQGTPSFAWTVDGLEDAPDAKVDATVPKLLFWALALDKYLSGVTLA